MFFESKIRNWNFSKQNIFIYCLIPSPAVRSFANIFYYHHTIKTIRACPQRLQNSDPITNILQLMIKFALSQKFIRVSFVDSYLVLPRIFSHYETVLWL